MLNNEFDVVCLNPSNADDVRGFRSLLRPHFDEVGGLSPRYDEGKYVASVLKRMLEPGRWCLLAKNCANETTGFSWFKIDRDERVGWGFILEFYVRPDSRRKGLGRHLVEQSCKLLADSGVRQVWLSSNPPAEVFWQKCGFQFTGEIAENGKRIMMITL